MVYDKALKKLGVKNIPKSIVAQAMLFEKLNRNRNIAAMKNTNGNGNGKAAYRERGLQIRTWGNLGEGY